MLVPEITSLLVRSISNTLITDDIIKEALKQLSKKNMFFDLASSSVQELLREEDSTKNKAEEARQHIGKASDLIDSIRSELETQTQQLDQLLEQIEERKKDALHYATLAKTNQDEFTAYRKEMERVLREELIKQANKNKHLRFFISVCNWFVTLVLGAAVGYYFPQILSKVNEWLNTLK